MKTLPKVAVILIALLMTYIVFRTFQARKSEERLNPPRNPSQELPVRQPAHEATVSPDNKSPEPALAPTNKTPEPTVLPANSSPEAFSANIFGTVTLKGTPPPEKENGMIKADPNCGRLHPEPVTTRFYVVGANRGLGDVFIMLKGVKPQSDGASAPPVILDQVKCQYEPYIFAVQTNQKILVRNSDQLLHNVHPTPARTDAGNKETNQAQMQGAPDIPLSFPAPEVFLRFTCNVHPWMFAFVCVVDHPYFAVTDKDGKYTIKNVPDGKYTMEVYHRKAAPLSSRVTGEVEIRGGNVTKDFVLEAK